MTNMTIEEFRRIYDEWKTSGLTIQKYCESTSFSESHFYYWKEKLRMPPSSTPSWAAASLPAWMSING